jgi:hypothetical protein
MFDGVTAEYSKNLSKYCILNGYFINEIQEVHINAKSKRWI